MDAAIRGQQVSRRGTERRAVHTGHAPAGFRDNQHTGGNIPWLEMLLPETVEPSRRDVAEVERGRAETPHRAGPAEERPEQADEIAMVLVHVVGEAGDQQRLE